MTAPQRWRAVLADGRVVAIEVIAEPHNGVMLYGYDHAGGTGRWFGDAGEALSQALSSLRCTHVELLRDGDPTRADLLAECARMRERLQHIRETAGGAGANRHAWALAHIGATAMAALAHPARDAGQKARTITINGDVYTVTAATLTYEEIVALGGGRPGVLYSMVWSHRDHRAGTLTPRQLVEVHEGMDVDFVVTGNA